jgi:hypothetical protein
MVDALNSSSHELSEIGVLLRDTRSLCIASFDLFCFKHCRRVCNKITHTLAKFDSQVDEECVGWADESQTLYLIWSSASLLRPLSNGNPFQCQKKNIYNTTSLPRTVVVFNNVTTTKNAT